MNRGWYAGIGLVILLLVGVWLWMRTPRELTLETDRHGQRDYAQSVTPSDGAILPAAPLGVVIDTNADLLDRSTLTVIGPNGGEVVAEPGTIDDSRVAIRQLLPPDSPDGRYEVRGSLCVTKDDCQSVLFMFRIDRSARSGYEDLRGQTEVHIDLQDVAFAPQHVIVSPGTKVIWEQHDPVTHYVNTDPHPAHTYFPVQNSRALEAGDMFELTFEKPGLYPYHCSAHTHMTGSVLAQEAS